jgi:hypothetical protein
VSNPTTETLLIFAGIPLAVIGIVYALVYASGAHKAKRYRPGRPYNYAPVWFLSRPETDGPAAVTSGRHPDIAALTATDANAVGVREHPGVTGGASDRW